MVISILGCGWYGTALAKALLGRNIYVKGSATSTVRLASLAETGIQPFGIKLSGDSVAYDADFFKCDVCVVSIPPRFRQNETADFLPKINQGITALNKHGVTRVIYISSTGVYGDRNGTVTELTQPVPDDEHGRLLLQAEDLFRRQKNFETTVIRFGGLVGPGRNPGRFFAAKTNVPNGKAPVNLIHLNDAVGITLAVLDKSAFGYTINACSPHHPPKGEFYTQAAIRSAFPAPHFADELSNWKIVDSIYAENMLDYQYLAANWQTCRFN